MDAEKEEQLLCIHSIPLCQKWRHRECGGLLCLFSSTVVTKVKTGTGSKGTW